MTENDIRGLGTALVEAAKTAARDEGSPPQVGVLISATGGLLIQALVDLNRIAAALEAIALNGQPRPL